MKILNLRHIGIPVPNLIETVRKFEEYGFEVQQAGKEVIDGVLVSWVKMKNHQDIMLEFLDAGFPHIAFTVDELDKEATIRLTPAGYRLQWQAFKALGWGGEQLFQIELVEKKG